MVAAVLSSGPPELQDQPTQLTPGQVGQVGRYLLIEPIGAGGMGVVYRAYDPQLEREVAVKLVRFGAADSEAQRRLLTEARVLARLAHPNVVAVHDAGVRGDEVFIAMELVKGTTLDRWLTLSKRSARAVLDVFNAAGQGLAAAHAAGVVHRDFKPQNVLVDENHGELRARVLDFGLAMPRATAAAGDAVLASGLLGGTPAYMAPEQHRGERADARADQFSFCVALFEALAGERPFLSDSVEAARENVLAGRLRKFPTRRDLPRRAQAAIERGLSVDPAARFPTMGDLLAALAPPPTRPGVWAGLAAVGFAALVTATLLMREPPCAGAEASMARVWGEPRRAAIAEAFRSNAAPGAMAVHERFQLAVDDFARRWVEQRQAACSETLVHHEQSQTAMDLRFACLDRRLAELDGLLFTVPGTDGASLVEHALPAVAALTPLEACADVRWLGQQAPPPPEAQAAVAQLTVELSATKALVELGRYAQALERATDAHTHALAAAHAPAIAEARYWLGASLHHLARYAESRDHLKAAALGAMAADDGRALVRAAGTLVDTISAQQSQLDEGELWLQLADARVTALGGDRALTTDLLVHRAGLEAARGHFQRARDLGGQALGELELLFGPNNLRVGYLLTQLGVFAFRATDWKQSEAWLHRAQDVLVGVYGARHPAVAAARCQLGNSLGAQGRAAEALAELSAVLPLQEEQLGKAHPDVAATLHATSLPLIQLGRLDEAKANLERAIAIITDALGAEHPRLAASFYHLGYLHSMQGDFEAAWASHSRALHIRERTFGVEHAMVADICVELGNARRSQGRWADALAAFERALRVRETALGPENLRTLYTLTDVASAHLGLGQPALARPLVERALAGLERAEDADAGMVAQTKFLLARALPRSERVRARALASAAQAHYAAHEGAKAEAEEVRRWLLLP